MTVRLNTGIRNNIISTASIVGSLGNGTAVLDIYSGAQPASADDAPTGTLLCSITAIGWNAASGGAATITGTKTGTAAASGTAGWGRLRNTGDTMRVDGTVGTAGTDFIIDDTALVAGNVVALTAATISQPAS